MSKRHNILPTRDNFFISYTGKIENVENQMSFLRSGFIAGDSHIKLISSQAVVLNENAMYCFSNNVHLLKYFPIKLPQNCFDSFNYTNQIVI